MPDMVVLSLERWDDVWRRNQHLVAGLLRADPRLRVLFVEPPADPAHSLRRRRTPLVRGGGLRIVDGVPGIDPGRLWTFQGTKWLPRRIDPWADAKLTRQVLRAANRVGMIRPVLWVNDPSGAALLRATGWPSLYDVTDDWVLAQRSSRERSRTMDNEEFLLQHSRVTIVCSPALRTSKARANRPQPLLVPNAVDLEAFRARHPRPTDLPRGRVVLYAGTVHLDRVDVDLCIHLADALGRNATLALVGPVDLPTKDRQRLERAGAVLLGARPASTVPAYLTNADVLVVPHVVTPFTESLDPIKAYEYQAASRPVVTTPVAGFRDSPDPRVTVATNPKAFVDAVQSLLREPRAMTGPEPPSWRTRVAQVQSILDRLFALPQELPTTVFVSHTGRPGGGELALVRYLELTTRPAQLITFEDSNLWRRQPHSVRVLAGGLRSVGALRRALKAAAPSLVVANTMRAAFVAALVLPRESRLIYWVRDGLRHSGMSVAALTLTRLVTVRRTHGFLANSQWTAETVRSVTSTSRIQVAHSPSGVRGSDLKSRFPRAHHGGKVRLLYLGRLAEWKAPHVAVEALRHLRAEGVDCTLTIAGEALFGERRYRHRLEVSAADVEGVFLAGHVDDVNSLLDSHDVLVHCSTRPEPFGQVIVQALAHGLPVAATDGGGAREILCQGGGVLYSPGDAKALAMAVRHILTDYAHLSAQALKAAQSFTDERSAELIDMYLSGWST